MNKIVTLGEIMLRLSTVNNNRIAQSNVFSACYGGSEANVAVSLACFGHNTSFVSKVPQNELGDSAIRMLKSNGVCTTHILRGGNRLGIYFYESGACIRSGKVIYDRAGSAMAQAKPDEFDFDTIFEGADWFHWSGITPAISDDAAEIIRLACIAAKSKGITVSCDVNYRSMLWDSKKATRTIKPLMQYVDIFIGNAVDAELCLGYAKTQNPVIYNKDIIGKMYADFGFKYIAFTQRKTLSAVHNGLSAVMYDGNGYYESKYYDIDNITERVGTGDAFDAGIIHGLLSGYSLQDTLEFATAADVLKHTINGDCNCVSIEDVQHLADNGTAGVRR